MRTITVEKTLYTWPELSDEAKDHVRQTLDTFEFSAECVLEDFQEVAAILGFYDVSPSYSGFWSQGDGASFTGRYTYAKGAAKEIREYAGQDAELWRIADELQALQARYFYRITARIYRTSHHYAHENTVCAEVSDNNGRDLFGAESDFLELARDLMHWLYSQLEKAYDDSNSDEYLAEHCEANGYEFDVNGVPQ